MTITFTYKGKDYTGTLNEVSGGAQALWFLYINNFYQGQLFIRQGKFVFTSQTGKFEELGEYFGEILTKNNLP